MQPTVLEAKQSKGKVTIILIIAGILALASIGTAYYYFQIKDLSPQESNAADPCACYFVQATDTIKSCADADPKMAFEFRTGKIQEDGTCSANCDLRTASALTSPSGTTPEVLACKMTSFTSDFGCIDIGLSQETGKRVANEVDPGSDVIATAKFSTPSNLATPDTPYYSSFSVLVNGVKEEFQVAQATTTGTGVDKTYEISKTIKDFANADSLTVQAIGQSTSGSDVTSEACLRTIAVSTPKAPTCTNLDATIIRTATGAPKVNEVSLTTSSVSAPDTISVKFTLGSSNQTLTTKNLKSVFSNNTLVLGQSYLYNASNFVDAKSFSILNNQSTDIPISAEVYVDGTKINSSACTGTFDLPAVDDDDRTPTDGGDGTDGDTDDPDDRDDQQTTEDTSNFTVTASASRTCAERTSPDNVVVYTIVIRNRDTETEKVVRVENKLPLGFRYTNGSTDINGVSVADAGNVSTSQVGSSQLITFRKTSGWSVAAGGTLTIRFSSLVYTTALSGTNLDEVVVVPENDPVTPSAVRTSEALTVAQSCTAPETGLFDSLISKVILGCMIIVLGFFLYFSQSGLVLSTNLLSWGPIKAMRKAGKLASWKTNNPRKYFEEKLIEKIDKKKD